MLQALLISILTSAGVSALITLIFETYITKRVQYHLDLKLSKYRADIESAGQARRALLLRRVEAYPKLVEFCYRTRNMARDLTRMQVTSESIVKLTEQVRELEELVFRFREDLEAEDLFSLTHTYKNLLLEFSREASELSPPREIADPALASDRLASRYMAVEQTFKAVTEALKRKTEALAKLE